MSRTIKGQGDALKTRSEQRGEYTIDILEPQVTPAAAADVAHITSNNATGTTTITFLQSDNLDTHDDSTLKQAIVVAKVALPLFELRRLIKGLQYHEQVLSEKFIEILQRQKAQFDE